MNTLNTIKEKVLAGERITDADALELYHSPDLLSIGALAHAVNLRKNQGVVYYNINRHINPTNICVMSCKFCAFARKPGEVGAYAYSIDEIISKAQEAVDQGATEVHMVGGLHPRWNLQHYINMLGAIKEGFPSLHIKGFTAVEIDWLAKKARKSAAEVLTLLREAGLGSLPGGGAEIFHDSIRAEITAKLSTDEWLGIHRTAHLMGMHSNCTMLYGHVEAYEHRVYHLSRLRELQDETKGFNAFIPLSFQPHNNDMGISRYTFGFDDLKNLAVARIYLDNFMHIKSYWVMMGQDIAQLGLYFGANDLDGTVIQEKISNMAGGRGGVHMTQAALEQFIRKTGLTPIERDTLYRPIKNELVREAQASQISDSPSTQISGTPITLNSPPSLADLLQLSSPSLYFEAGQLAEALCVRQHQHRVSFAPSLDWPVKDYSGAVASLLALIQTQERILTKRDDENAIAPTLLNVDLAAFSAAGSDLSFGELLSLIAYGKEKSGLSVTLSGVGGLRSLVEKDELTLVEAFRELKAAGLDSFQSAYHETLAGLSEGEVLAVFAAAHASGIATLAKVELRVGKNCKKLKWEEYLQKILAFRKMPLSSDCLLGLSIEVAPGSTVAPAEYLQAVSLARLGAPNISHIGAPLLFVPIHGPSKAGVSTEQRPEEKLTPLLAMAGASDLGQIPIGCLQSEAVLEELLSAGFTPILRDGAFGSLSLEAWQGNARESLRHIPRLRVYA